MISFTRGSIGGRQARSGLKTWLPGYSRPLGVSASVSGPTSRCWCFAEADVPQRARLTRPCGTTRAGTCGLSELVRLEALELAAACSFLLPLPVSSQPHRPSLLGMLSLAPLTSTPTLLALAALLLAVLMTLVARNHSKWSQSADNSRFKKAPADATAQENVPSRPFIVQKPLFRSPPPRPPPSQASAAAMVSTPAVAIDRVAARQPYDAFLVLDVEATCQPGTDFNYANEIIASCFVLCSGPCLSSPRSLFFCTGMARPAPPLETQGRAGQGQPA